MIEISNLSKKFKSGLVKKSYAVKDVALNIDRGSILGIVGNSGCGKSTLARMILGLVPSTSGKVKIKGVEIGNMKRKEMAQTIQIIFQHPISSFDPKKKIRYSLEEPLRVNGRYDSSSAKVIREMMDTMKLDDILLDRYPNQISGGEAQRLSIARVLLLKPEIIVLDEPTSMLDVSTQASIFKTLVEIKEKYSLTLVIISHDLEVVSKICHNIAVMKDGKIVEKGNTNDIIKNPKTDHTRRLVDNFRFFE